MDNNDFGSMYVVEDDDEEVKGTDTSIKIQTKGLLTEMTIAGEKVQMINPTEIYRLMEAVRKLERKLASTNYQLKLLENQVRQKNKQISDIKQELNNKIGYE